MLSPDNHPMEAPGSPHASTGLCTREYGHRNQPCAINSPREQQRYGASESLMNGLEWDGHGKNLSGPSIPSSENLASSCAPEQLDFTELRSLSAGERDMNERPSDTSCEVDPAPPSSSAQRQATPVLQEEQQIQDGAGALEHVRADFGHEISGHNELRSKIMPVGVCSPILINSQQYIRAQLENMGIPSPRQFVDHPFDRLGAETEGESSGSDLPCLSHRTKRQDPRPRSFTPETSRKTSRRKGRGRLRRGLKNISRHASRKVSHVLIPARHQPSPTPPAEKTTRLRSVPCFLVSKMADATTKLVIELPGLAPDVYHHISGFCTSPRTIATRMASRKRYTKKENARLVKLKKQEKPKLSWAEIQTHFPSRTVNSLQVHYSTKLKFP